MMVQISTAQADTVVRRSDFTVTRPYPALFLFHGVCVNAAGEFGDDSVCKVNGPVATDYTPVPMNIFHGVLRCAQLSSDAEFRWHFNRPSTMAYTSQRKYPADWLLDSIETCGHLAAAIADLSDFERERYYADCAQYTHRTFGHCFLLAKLDWGYILGYAFYEPLEKAPAPPRTRGQLPPNAVCVEEDQEAHPLSECPGIPVEEIDDSAFPTKAPPSAKKPKN